MFTRGVNPFSRRFKDTWFKEVWLRSVRDSVRVRIRVRYRIMVRFRIRVSFKNRVRLGRARVRVRIDVLGYGYFAVRAKSLGSSL